MELDLVGAGSGGAVFDIHPPRQSCLDRIYDKLKILFTDLLPGIFSSNIPNALKWVYRTYCTRTLTSHSLGGASKAAQLFVHGEVHPRPGGETPALLLLHGEHAHPFSLLHLADIAKQQGRSVFSVHLAYDDEHPERHRSLLSQSIDKIDQIIQARGGKLSSLVLAGHSRGAMEAANEAFAVNNPKVNGVIAIAGRFKVITPSDRPCRPSLEASVNALWDKIGHWSQSLRVPFYQIAAKRDWCMDPEASIARTDHEHLYVDAGHLGVINHPSTLNQFKEWLAKT